MMICVENFDWGSFRINIYAGLVYFILGTLLSIWLVPRFTLRLLRKKNQKFLKRKFASIIRELCEFLSSSQIRDKELNQEQIVIFTNKKDIKNYAFVGMCPMNILSPITYPKVKLVIYEYYRKLDPETAYKELSHEYARLKVFRTEIEKMLSAHSLYLDDVITLRISDLCSDIRGQEIQFVMNYEYQNLLEKTNDQRTGVFGINDLPDIYEKILLLIRDLMQLKYFEYRIENK